MRTINYQSFFDFGKGVDSISESACGQAVEITTATTIQGAGGQYTEFRLDIIESQTEFQKALGISSSASLRYGLASVSGANVDAKFQFSEDNTFSEYNLNVLGRGWPYQVDLTEYKFLDLPIGPNIIDFERQRELLTYLGKQRSDALVKLKRCQYVRANPQEFINVTPEVLQRLGESEQQLLEVVDRIYDQSSSCFNDYIECKFSESNFIVPPVDFPARIASTPEPDLGTYVEVPQLGGVSQEEAKTALQRLGLAVEVFTSVSVNSAIGKVISQEPAALTQVLLGSRVRLGIGDGGIVERPDFPIDIDDLISG